MNPIVSEFLEKKRNAQRVKFEKERDSLLVSLGLVETVKEYSPTGQRSSTYFKLDEETGQYYCNKKIPVEVTDEEFEEIKQVAGQTSKSDQPSAQSSSKMYLDNNAERFLSVVNTISLVISCAVAFILFCMSIKQFIDYDAPEILFWGFLYSALMVFVALIGYAFLKVYLNMSNNLHELNAKVK